MSAEAEHWRALVAGFWGGVVFALYHLSVMLLSGQRPAPWDIIKALGNAAVGIGLGTVTASYVAPGVAVHLPAGWRGDVDVAGFAIGVLAFSVIPSVIKAATVAINGLISRKAEGVGQ